MWRTKFLFNSIPKLPIFEGITNPKYFNKIAVKTSHHSFTYSQLFHDLQEISKILQIHKGEKVSFLFNPGYEYLVTKLAIWKSKGVAVPLCNSHPTPELEYFIQNSKSSTIVYEKDFEHVLEPLKNTFKHVKFVEIKKFHPKQTPEPTIEFENVDLNDESLIIYTSGTTSKPKGVVSTHNILSEQMNCLIEAWEWSSNDHLLHCLPLHHIHGVLISLNTIRVGGTCEFLKFKEKDVWEKLISSQVNLFMAVPTIYQKLIKYYEKEIKRDIKPDMKRIRLMVSGSASLPDTLFLKWKEITGHTLLERYGMTEIGLVISNPYRGERIMGHVGLPFDSVQIKIDSQGDQTQGELLIKGPTVFKEYFEKEKSTQEAFNQDGWFKTGDYVQFDVENNSFKILGRISMDIIKSGGYKISALEIERVLLKNPKIHEVCVVGIPDEEWGERIGCIYVGEPISPEEFRIWCKSHLATYKIPSKILQIEHFERNAMGKINKNNYVSKFQN